MLFLEQNFLIFPRSLAVHQTSPHKKGVSAGKSRSALTEHPAVKTEVRTEGVCKKYLFMIVYMKNV